MPNLELFLREKADELAPLDSDYPDCRSYQENVNDDALTDAWLENRTPFIWKVGVLAQWDSNKCDWMRVFIGHEREPGNREFIGMLHYQDGENDDIGRSLSRAVELAGWIHPAMEND